jgi:hypothetical protein
VLLGAGMAVLVHADSIALFVGSIASGCVGLAAPSAWDADRRR